jgi:23S rRNA (cytosine1962-C5)-methyltransferase
MDNMLNLKMILINDILVCEKPHGIATHATDKNRIGLVEWFSEKLGQNLYTYQRLDASTSGLITFALSPQKASEMTELWKAHSVSKNYLFISDKKIKDSKYENSKEDILVESYILKEKNAWVNKKDLPPNSWTQFKLLETFGNFSLWRAQPKSGKSHQIRLHAEKIGIPILGDSEHGGSAFFRVCLHSESLSIPGYGDFHSKAPHFFYDLSKLEDLFWCQLEDAFHRREMLFNAHQNSLRFLHNELLQLKIDFFESHWWVYDYSLTPNQKTKVLEFIKNKSEFPIYIRQMKNRGQSPIQSQLQLQSELQTEQFVNKQWQTHENQFIFEMRSNQGLSPGLFLDQRENRKWVKQNSKNKKVLNLFSYTGGFSLAAALGQARTVTTVDLSKTFIDWSKANFSLNGLDPDRYEFWATDSRIFINGCQKRDKKYELIICDPPSFSRGKNGLFRIDKDAEQLIDSLITILEVDGKLMFCTNYEKWDLQNLKDNISLLDKKNVKLEDPLHAGLDCELPGQETILKTLILTKIC